MYSKRIYWIYGLVFALFLVPNLQAQQITIPYLIDFESQTEVGQWVLNPGTPDAHDQWMIGNATYSEGENALYVSCDDGLTAAYGNRPDIIMAYRTVKFPNKAGKYNISFDWKSLGDEKNARLYVYIGLEQMLTSGLYFDAKGNDYGLLDIVSENSGLLSNKKVLNQFCKLSDGTQQYDCLYGNRKWQNVFIQGDASLPDVSINLSASASARNYILAFIWVNNNTDPEACRLGACIDNIQIASAELKRPAALEADIVCEDSTLHLSWQSTLFFFDIEYRNINDPAWRRLTNVPATDNTVQSYSVKIKQEGNYTIRVRGYNANKTDTSAFAAISNVVYWCPDNHCINYINLTGEDVECRYGDEAASWPDCNEVGMFDYGEEAKESRHTVNWIENRYDPLTTGSHDVNGNSVSPLRTIPDGAMASVRLGNWDNGSQRESVTYTFEVDSVSQAILIMKYAIVFEDPGHPGKQSLFNIIVLDENDRPINPTCGQAKFVFDDATEWNVTRKEGYGDVYWKDWTSLGLDLRQYHGRTVKVRISVADCGQGGHFGYAYYMLDCVSANIDTDNCGSSSTITLNAPDGFSYLWTDSKGHVVGTERQLNADAGYETYTCEACMLEAKDCCFTLSTDFAPRYPAPDYSWEQIPSNCQNIVRFTNLSHVLTRYEDHDVHTTESCEQITWDFLIHGEHYISPVDQPAIVCNPAGDTVLVSLRATLGGGQCDSLLQETVIVPGILCRDSLLRVNLCEGESYIFNKQQYNQTGTYYDYKTNWAGCDSTTVLDLTVFPKSGITRLTDTVCSVDLPYELNGYSYPTEGMFTQSLRNQYDCDSTVSLSLTVIDKLEVEVDSLPTLCADGERLTIDYHIMANAFDSLAIRFIGTDIPSSFYNQMIYDNSLTRVVYPYENTIRPNRYRVQLEFFQARACGNQIFTLEFDMQYQSSIIEQKWNDVLAVLNEKYNGGYTFATFQWYKDDQPIEGETGAYLYQPLDTAADYSVLLGRTDGVTIRTCPFRPVLHTDTYAFPTIVKTGAQIPIRKSPGSNSIERITIYTLLGQIYSATETIAGEGYVMAPSEAGHYIVEIVDDTGVRTAQHLLVRTDQ